MFRIRYIVYFIFFQCLIVNSLSQNIYEIIPGKGVGKLLIGTSKARTLEIVGTPEIREDFDEALAGFRKLKSNPYNWLPFQIGFDSVYIYTNGSSRYPVYSLYFKNDSLNCISLACFLYEKWWIQKYHINQKVHFYDEKEAARDSVNSFYAVLDYSQGRDKFVSDVYYQEGIGLMYENEKLKLIDIFNPIDIITFFGFCKIQKP